MKRILVASDGLVEIRKGELFHCLAGSGERQTYKTGLDDLVEQYEETVDDGWDVVVINCDKTEVIERLVDGIWDIDDDQLIIAVSDHFSDPGTMAPLMCVPRDEKKVRMIFAEIGVDICCAF